MEHHFLRGARVYLSGPMDFVASRADERKLGWRNRVGDFLREKGAIVFDPWFKPEVRGARQYGLEDIHAIDVRAEWTFEPSHLEQGRDTQALQLLDRLVSEVPIKPNPAAIPGLWYLPLVGGGNFFDGFGFANYREKFDWSEIPMDEREDNQLPQNPLLPFLERLTHELPQRWNDRLKKYVPDDDWLLWELEMPPGDEAHK